MTPFLSPHAASADSKKCPYKMNTPLPELLKNTDMHAKLTSSYGSAMTELTTKYEDAGASKLVKEEEDDEVEGEEEETAAVKKFETPALGQEGHGRAYNYLRSELPSYLRCRGEPPLPLPDSGGFCKDCKVPSEYEVCTEQCEAFFENAGFCTDKCLASPAEGGNQLGFDVDCTRKCQLDSRKLVSEVCGIPMEELRGRLDDLFEHLIAAFDLDPNA